MPIPRAALACVIAVILTAMGCGPSRGLVPVEGQIRFAGKTPPAAGYVFFVPLDPPQAEGEKLRPRSGTALFMQDGAFRVTTFRDGDGLRPGRYEARVECSIPRAGASREGAASSAVPAHFRPPEITIPPDGPRPVRVDIDVR